MRDICILGGGSAGLIAALTLRTKLPQFAVKVVRSPEIGVIGVGEGTTSAIPRLLFQYLGLRPHEFYARAEPTWKMGIRFLWGPRPQFFYSFAREYAAPISGGTVAGARCLTEPDLDTVGPVTAAMAAGKCFARHPLGAPAFHTAHAFHIENRKFVAWLESAAAAAGAEIVDGTVAQVEGTPEHVTALHLATGERIAADFFIDASGFRSEIAGRHQGTPWRDFSDALFCDRALISGWERCEDEPILPYTTVETMASGWCWRIEHEHYINRGYVHSSRFIDEETALAEYRRLNPRATAEPRTVRFRTGCLERAWTGNVVAVGNAAGFVEPLEATALQLLAVQCANLVSCLELCDGQPNDSVRALHNRTHTLKWEAVRDFLALHYAFNTRLDTPFWRHCRAETPLGGAAEFVAFFRENGPAPDTAQLLLDPVNPFGAEGYLALLIGQNVPVARQFRFSSQDDTAWRQQQQRWKDQAGRAMTVAEGLAALRAAGNRWTYAPDARHAV